MVYDFAGLLYLRGQVVEASVYKRFRIWNEGFAVLGFRGRGLGSGGRDLRIIIRSFINRNGICRGLGT